MDILKLILSFKIRLICKTNDIFKVSVFKQYEFLPMNFRCKLNADFNIPYLKNNIDILILGTPYNMNLFDNLNCLTNLRKLTLTFNFEPKLIENLTFLTHLKINN